ncbi:YpmS family protein [Aneurinibacillus tyrosinisolvens]|uniref:YpmS family protein n=1 Tax=Aneurinibacillus tyrosinisolvens TaxID=1443435 RepID=UPI00063F5303|nr:YpmS family protein [Aneurinibacillus tyrosinisolvens]
MFEKHSGKNRWKTLFWGLMAINAVLLLAGMLLFFLPPSHSNEFPEGHYAKQGESEFTISSTRENLTQLANGYLADLPKNQTLDYSIFLGNDVQLRGTLVAFDRKIPLTMTFNPFVQKNGDLILQQKSIALGRLHLPNMAVLSYIKNHYPMPEWVTVHPSDESIYLAVTKLKTKSGFRVRVEKLSLEQNELVFKIAVPNRTLGF